MADHKGLLLNSTIEKDEHDELFHSKRVSDIGNDNQILIFDAVGGITYIGNGASGLATSVTGWLVTKIDETSNPTTIKHAVGILDDREELIYS